MTGEDPKVYVLLLNWRGWKDTIECLESVLRQPYPRYQVIVCDNDSGDGSLERIAAWARGELAADAALGHLVSARSTPPVRKPVPCVHLTREEAECGAGDAPLVLVQTGGNLGFAGGNNVGLRYAMARGDAAYVWLLNNDTVVDPGALLAMVQVAESDPEVGMVGSKLLYYDEPGRIQAAGGGRVIPWQGLTAFLGEGEEDRRQWEEPLDPDYITGASLLVRASLVEELGGLDERYFLYSEEVDWCLRARERGWRLRYAPGSLVWHKGGKSVGHRSALHDYHTVRGMLLLVRRFYPALLPAAFLYSMYRCVAPKVFRLQFGRLRAVLRAYRDFLSNASPSFRPGIPDPEKP
ncbi:MAG: glycosyltransferase family 2 protein [Gemmatimonadota bacterium]|nr:glycosyltransferase family 2 protein [Gemmatimonadota bacterium]